MTDDLTGALRAQMHELTAADALPTGFVGRVHAGVRRRRLRQLTVAGSAAAAVGVVGVALLVSPGTASAPSRLATAPSSAPSTAPYPGPSDDELRSAQWFHYESTPSQADMARAPESRWDSRDGRHLALQPDGTVEVYSTRARFAYGPGEGATFEEVLALPADPAALARTMRAADSGRAPEERVIDQVRQLLGRAPVLLPVRRALVEAAVQQEGAVLVAGAEDSRGRPALRLERTDRDGAVTTLFVDPGSYRLLEDRVTAGPDFPTPPTDGPVPGSGQELRPGQSPEPAPTYRPGQVLYQETFTLWSTTPPPGTP